ncbi:MAG: thioredoxin family protein [bacterium]
MSEQEKKGFILAFPLIIVFFLFSSLFGCTGIHKQSLVKNGDQIRLDYTCRFPDGTVVATTSKNIAEDDASYPKSSAFARQNVYNYLSLKAGEQIPISKDNFLTGIDDVIKAKLSQFIVGSEVEKEYSFELDANVPANLKPEDRFLSMTRVRRRPKELKMSKASYIESHRGMEPTVGQEVKIPDPLFSAKITSIGEESITAGLFAEPNSIVPVPPFRKGIIRDKGDHYDIEIDARAGDLVRAGSFVGKISNVNDQAILVDFGHPFGGEKLTCQVKALANPSPQDTSQSRENQPEDKNKVQKGDLIYIDYTISLEDGQVFFTTQDSVDQDPGRVKMAAYQKPKQFTPVEMIVGELDMIPGLSEALIGFVVHQTGKITIPADKLGIPRDEKKIQKLQRVKRIPKIQTIPADQYVQKFKTFPNLHDRVHLTPYFDADVTEVTPQYARLEAIVEDGEQIEDPFGTAGVYLDGNDVVISMQPTIGASIQLDEGKVGIITQADDESFTVDFNHPLAGKNIVIDFEVVSLTKESEFKGKELSWMEDHDQALALARQENKPVVLLLYADWCPWCQKLFQETFPHPLINALADDFIWLKINSEKEKKYKELYQQDGYPLIVLMDAHSDIIKKMNEFVTAPSLRKELDLCLENH